MNSSYFALWGNEKSSQSKPSRTLMDSCISYWRFISNKISFFDEENGADDNIFTDVDSDDEDKEKSLCSPSSNQATAKEACIVTLAMQPHLKTLGIDVLTNSPLSWVQIRVAYKTEALKAHPDKGGSDSAFQRIKDALDILEKLICNDSATTTLFDFQELNKFYEYLSTEIQKFSVEVKETNTQAKKIREEQAKTAQEFKKLEKKSNNIAVDLKILNKLILKNHASFPYIQDIPVASQGMPKALCCSIFKPTEEKSVQNEPLLLLTWPGFK